LNAVDEVAIPDRIEAATFLIAAAMTKGEIELKNVNPYHLSSVLAKLEDSGSEIDVNGDTIYLKQDEAPKPIDFTTSVYPGLPTDLQAQWVAYMMATKGMSKVTDTIYTDRFKHIPELQRLGADIKMVDNVAIINGGKSLSGATLMSSDLRGSVALVLAGLISEGSTEVLRIYHLDRGYEKIEDKFAKLGATIKRVKTELI
jgi:UDP-N-acetylglucosamine 1-carboxyvinyltransferase